MNDDRSIKDKLTSLTSRPAGRETEEEATEDYGLCGWLYGIRDRALFLELRLKTGNIHALGYAWLERAEFDPAEGIMLHFLGCKVRIQGNHLAAPLRNQNRLFDGFLRHRIPWVQEMDRPSAQVIDGPVITKITISR